MSRPMTLFALALLALLLSACAVNVATPDLGDALAADGDLSELAALLEDEELLATLEGLDEVTIFAPVDDAFAAVGSQDATLSEVLSYHAVAETLLASDLADGDVLATLYPNSALAVELDGGAALVDGSGGTVAIIATDIEIANGVIHKIAAVLTPPEPIATVAADAGFSTLVAALVALDLAATFDDPTDGPYTVFAPTDDAFATLLEELGLADLDELVDTLGAEAVTDILLYHVVDGLVGESAAVAAATAGDPVPTLLAGAELALSLAGGAVIVANADGVADAEVGPTNVVAANGVIHVVDQVLIPPAGD